MNKLRLSAYLCTPSGNPKLALWLSLSILHYFSKAPKRCGKMHRPHKAKKYKYISINTNAKKT